MQYPHPDNIARLAFRVAFYVNLPVDFRRFSPRTSIGDIFTFLAAPFHQNLHHPAFQRPIDFFGDFALDAHQIMVPLLNDGLRQLPAHLGGRGSLLPRIGEDPDPLKALFFDETPQRLILRIRFPGKTDDKRRTNHRLWDTGANFIQQDLDAGPVIRTPHTAQHSVMGMLERQIDILADFRLRRNRIDKFVGKKARIGVEEAQETDALHLAQFLEKPR